MRKAGKKTKRGALGRFLRRTLLVLVTLAVLITAGFALILKTVLTGPSETARDTLTLTLLDHEITQWIPEQYLDPELIAQIQNKTGQPMEEMVTDPALISVNPNTALTYSEEWAGCPNGIRVETYNGVTYTAHILIIRDPALVNWVRSAGEITDQLASSGALAAIGCGGSAESGYVGFTQDNVLVAAKSKVLAESPEWVLRAGCEAGPVLMINGQSNTEVFGGTSGYAPRSAIGQRADGAVIFLAIDGYRPDSLGATYHDLIDILAEYGAVNACCLSSDFSALAYRDETTGKAERISRNSPMSGSDGNVGFWLVSGGKQEG